MNNLRKIAIVTTTNYAESLVGGKYESDEISRGLQSLGFEVKIFSADKLSFLDKIREKILRLYCRKYKESLFQSYFSLGKAVSVLSKNWDPDVYISRDIFCSKYLLCGKPIHLIQDVTSKISDSKFQSGKINQDEYQKMKHIEKIVYKKCEFIIAKDIRLKKYLEGFVDENKIEVLYPPIPEYFKHVDSGKDYLVKTYGVDVSKKIVLYNPTRLIKQKGVEIVEYLTNVFPNVIFLTTLSSDKMNKKNTISYGITNREKMPLIYSGSDLLIVPSIQLGEHTEGISQVAIEAMLCGIPVIASNVGGLKDHHNNINLVEPNKESFEKAINQWLSGKWSIDTNKTKKYAEKFYTANYIGRYESLINKIII